MDDMSKEQQYGLTQWKLVRSAIEHENTLINHRVSWLLATQLFLFAAFGSIFVEAIKNELFNSTKVCLAFLIISSIGIYVCILAWTSIRAANKMVNRLRDWWLMHYTYKQDNVNVWIDSVQSYKYENRYPPVNGIFIENLYHYFSIERLPHAIVVCWFLLLGLTTSLFANKHHKIHPFYFLIAFSCISIVGYTLLMYIVKPYLNEKSDKLRKELEKIHTPANK